MPVRARYGSLVGFLIFFVAGIVNSQSRNETLSFADKVRMVNCDPAMTTPCFRIKLNAIDARREPVQLDLPSGPELARDLTIIVGNQEITPFYAAASGAGKANVQGRIALILIDISGSMINRLSTGETRFGAAKAALGRFIENFEDGVDQVAIVPFESHHVEPTIRNAVFARDKQAAEQQIASLPVPGRRNNTALYSSVTIGLDVLRHKIQESGRTPAENLLIIMTDGKNEVYKGDDAGLLDGPPGLQTAASKVKESGVQVIGIGFSDSNDVDETALKEISTTFYMAQDAQKLNRIFTVARRLLNNRITATFASPWADRASLASRNLRVSARLKLPSGDTLSSDEQTWTSPAMGIPAFDENCSVAEKQAILDINWSPHAGNWVSILRPVLVFVGLGGLILILWFWVPRLLWPERELGMMAETRRWMGTQMSKTYAGAPTGFRSRKDGNPIPRTPSDATVIVPKTGFTKTRLDRDAQS